jgi:hypothetical protein
MQGSAQRWATGWDPLWCYLSWLVKASLALTDLTQQLIGR